MSQERRATIVALHDLHRNSRVLKQAASLADAGYKVTVVGIMRSASDAPVEDRAFGRIVRVRTTDRFYADAPQSSAGTGESVAPRRSSALSQVRTYVGRLRENRLMSRAVTDSKPDIVIASDLTALPAGRMTSKKTGCRLLYDVRDIRTADDAQGSGILTRLWRMTERTHIARVDAVTCVSPLMAHWYAETYSLDRTPSVIYNGPFACASDVPPSSTPMKLIFQGHLVADRGLDDLVLAMRELRGIATLTLQGWGEAEGPLRRQVSDAGLEDVVQFVAPCAPDEVGEWAARHDIGVVSLRGHSTNHEAALPIKTFTFMGAGLALLVADLPQLRAFVQENACGDVFEPGDPGSIVAAVRRFAQSPQLLLDAKRNSRAACKEYAWENQGAKFVSLVDGLFGSVAKAGRPT